MFGRDPNGLFEQAPRWHGWDCEKFPAVGPGSSFTGAYNQAPRLVGGPLWQDVFLAAPQQRGLFTCPPLHPQPNPSTALGNRYLVARLQRPKEGMLIV